MTKDHSFFSVDAKASPGEVITLGLIAAVILAALATTVTAMLIASKMPGAFWAAFFDRCRFRRRLRCGRDHHRGAPQLADQSSLTFQRCFNAY
jgi:hypothetical protein